MDGTNMDNRWIGLVVKRVFVKMGSEVRRGGGVGNYK